MFCPNCKAEYRPGFNRCADCNTDLVDKLPGELQETEEEIDPDIRFVEIMTTNNLSDIAFIQSILNDAGINYFIKNERMIAVSMVYDAVLMVEESQEKKVRELLKDVDFKYNRFAGGL